MGTSEFPRWLQCVNIETMCLELVKRSLMIAARE